MQLVIKYKDRNELYVNLSRGKKLIEEKNPANSLMPELGTIVWQKENPETIHCIISFTKRQSHLKN